MKLQAIQGYTVALSFLNMYESDGNTLTLIQKQMQIELSKVVSVYVKKHSKHLFKWVNKAWDRFLEITDGNDVTVDALTFSVQMVLKNPNIEKNKKLKSLAWEANKEFLFKKKETVSNAKSVVNAFYGRGDL